MSGNSIAQLMAADAPKLAASLQLDFASARLETQYLLQWVLHKPRAWLLAYPEYEPDKLQQVEYRRLLLRRLQGEPIAYLLGEREFFGLSFKVTPATLIPRPETELLVELALQHLPPQVCQVLDLGTGTGAIALSIAHARPDVRVVATDASPDALCVAMENARRLGVANADMISGSWFEPLGAQRFDIIVSNPPYVAADDPHLRQGDLPCEPLSALVSGAEGLDDIRIIIGQSPGHLQPGGWLLLEHGYDQAERVRELMQMSGLNKVFSVHDLSGIERVSGGCLA